METKTTTETKKIAKVFRHGTTRKPISIVQYCKTMIAKHPDLSIQIGTDSQNKKRYTYYATVIAFRYGHRGVHYVYNKNRIKRIRDKFDRLYRETMFTLDIANHLSDNFIPINALELDYNSDESTGSHALISATAGMCKAYGFDTIIKPDEQMAVKAADHLITR